MKFTRRLLHRVIKKARDNILSVSNCKCADKFHPDKRLSSAFGDDPISVIAAMREINVQ